MNPIRDLELQSILWGQMGSGKTYAVLCQAERLKAQGYDVILWDDIQPWMWRRPYVSDWAMFWRWAGQ